MPKKTVSAPKKARWTTAEKIDAKKKAAKKPHHRGQPDGPNKPKRDVEGKRPRAERSPRWDAERRTERAPRGYAGDSPRDERGDRGARGYDRDERRSYNRDDRAPRSFERGERGGTAYDRRDDRGGRTFERRNDRGPRRWDRDDRPARVSRDGSAYERPQRTWERREERGNRGFDRRNDRFDRREERNYERRDDRGFERRDDRRDDRAPRRFEDVAGHRKHLADDRPQRGWDRRDDRGERRDDRGPRNFERRDHREDRGYGRDNRRSFERRDDRGFERRDNRGQDAYAQQQRDDFAQAEADRAAADTWVKYESKARAEVAEVTEGNGFAAMGLPERLVERLARDSITAPFPIQAAAIPDALSGRDVLGRGQTGSGKTMAFGLPTIARLAESGKARPKKPRSLIMVPTRELAMQVSDALEPLVHVMGLRHKLVAGGLSYEPQIAALARGLDILIATPGRLTDLLERGALELDGIEIAILDEADHMADMGFLPDVTAILDAMPTGGQRLLFSATLDKGIDGLVERYMVDPVTHSTDDATASVSTMAHHLFLVEPNHKKVLTAELANRDGRTIVFARTKLGADRIASQLREVGVMAAALHGGLTQSARNRVLGAFRTGDMNVLVATDVAARGIHVDDVQLVLQVDPPADHKDYLHRSGRTARAGEAGAVVTLALPHQRKQMERLLGQAGVDKAAVRALPGDDSVTAAGGRTPAGVPVDAEKFRSMLEPARRAGRPGGGSRGGHRGGRSGGPRSGGPRSFGRPRHQR